MKETVVIGRAEHDARLGDDVLVRAYSNSFPAVGYEDQRVRLKSNIGLYKFMARSDFREGEEAVVVENGKVVSVTKLREKEPGKTSVYFDVDGEKYIFRFAHPSQGLDRLVDARGAVLPETERYRRMLRDSAAALDLSRQQLASLRAELAEAKRQIMTMGARGAFVMMPAGAKMTMPEGKDGGMYLPALPTLPPIPPKEMEPEYFVDERAGVRLRAIEAAAMLDVESGYPIGVAAEEVARGEVGTVLMNDYSQRATIPDNVRPEEKRTQEQARVAALDLGEDK